MPIVHCPMYTIVSIMVHFGPDSKTKVHHCADIVSLLSPSFGQATRLAHCVTQRNLIGSLLAAPGSLGYPSLYLPYRRNPNEVLF